MSPTLLSSCARATTAAEAAFRIDYPLAPSRATRVVAFDDHAAAVVDAAAREQWHHATFASVDTGTMATSPLVVGLEDVDAVLMVASTADGAQDAATLGEACRRHGVMTAGLVLSDSGGEDREVETLAALRPWARILLVPADQDDLVELLRAIRA